MNRNIFLAQKAILRGKMVLDDFFKKCYFYSFYFGFWSLVWWVGNYYGKLSSWKKTAEHKKKGWIWNYLELYYINIIQHYKSYPEKSLPEESDYRIWVFWAQGIDNMPALVRACYDNLLKRVQGEKVVLLTNENLGQYISLPISVRNCFEKGIIGYIHLSDIIRHSLLAKYGGLWIDATVWVTTNVPVSQLRSLPFYSAKDCTRQSHWASYLLGGCNVNASLFCFVRDMMIAVCEREKYWPDYLFMDYLIDYAFNHFPSVRETMMSCPDNNLRRSDLWTRMNKVFDEEEYMRIIKDNWMFKLSYKSHLVPMVNGELTYYGAMINGKLQ